MPGKAETNYTMYIYVWLAAVGDMPNAISLYIYSQYWLCALYF